MRGSLGVDRTSLFRWVGNRDALLSEVLWSLAIPTLVQAEHASAELSGGDRIAGILTHFVDDLITADYFRQFLRREPARALRLLTTKESPIQRRYVATAEWLVRRDLGDVPARRGDRPAGPRVPARAHVGVVHLRRPHLGRHAERRPRPRRVPPPAAGRRLMADYRVRGAVRDALERQRPVRPHQQHRLLRGDGHRRQRLDDPHRRRSIRRPVRPIALCASSSCEFRASASFPEQLEVGIGVERLGTTSITWALGILRAGEAEPIATGRFVHVFVDAATRRPTPVPAAIRTAIEEQIAR